MFVHIGNNIIINRNDILGVFNKETITQTKNFNIFFEKLKQENKIKKIDSESEKTIILVKKNKEILVYISNISTTALNKRIEKEI